MPENRETPIEQLVEQLHSYGVENFDRNRLEQLIDQFPSSSVCAKALVAEIKPKPAKRVLGAIAVIVAQLWQTWFPDRLDLDEIVSRIDVPDFEDDWDEHELSEMRQSAQETIELADHWLKVWHDIREVMRTYQIESVQGVDKQHCSPLSILSWIEDLSRALGEAAKHDPRYHHQRIDLARELLDQPRLIEHCELSLGNLRVDLAESVYRTAGPDDANRLYEEWLSQYPTNGHGWLQWANLLRFGSDDQEPDPEHAVGILRRGLAVDDVSDRPALLDMLAEIYFKLAIETGQDHYMEAAYDTRREAKEERLATKWYEELDTAKPLSDPDEIASQLCACDSERPPCEAIAAARRQPTTMIPRLIEIVGSAIDEFKIGSDPQHDGYIYALYILAELQASEAADTVFDLLNALAADEFVHSFDEIELYLSEIVAATFGHDPDRLDRILADTSLDSQVRWHIGSAYFPLVRDDKLTREEAVERLGQQLENAIRARDHTGVGICVYALSNFAPTNMLPLIREAYQERLVDEGLITLESIEETLEQGDRFFEGRLIRSRDDRIDDALDVIIRYAASTIVLAEDVDESGELDEAVPEPADVASGGPFASSFLQQVDEPIATVRYGTTRTGRNEPCPCGSGRKFKKCCGRNG